MDRDEAAAALATINLMPFPHASVECADALEIDLVERGVDAVFADPARRADGRVPPNLLTALRRLNPIPHTG